MKKLFILLAAVLSAQFSIACTAGFNHTTSPSGTVTFNNTSTGPGTSSAYASVMWNFGDGGSSGYSYMWSPIHTYAATGTYHVSLIVNWIDSLTSTLVCTDTVNDTVMISSIRNQISGTIWGDSTSYIDSFKVWLITYDSTTHIISAIDSTVAGGLWTADYSFYGMPAGSYFVKAASLGGPTSGTGMVPTYLDSSIYWSGARYATVSTGVLSGVDIYMQHGTVTSGPGFVAGNVLYGAGKMTHTTGTVGDPVVGLLIFLRDASNHLVASTRTDNSGNYSFSNIPTGDYSIYPEDMGFATTPANLTVTSATPSVSGVNFKQNSTSIVPITTGVANVTSGAHSIAIYPNPGNGNVTLLVGNHKAQTADVSVTNITGQKVYQSKVNVNANGFSQLNLSTLESGLYFINIGLDNAQYTQKLVIQH